MSGQATRAMRLYHDLGRSRSGRTFLRMSCLRDLAILGLANVVNVDPYKPGYFAFRPEDVTLSVKGGTWILTLFLTISPASDKASLEKTIRGELNEAFALCLPYLRYRVDITFVTVG